MKYLYLITIFLLGFIPEIYSQDTILLSNGDKLAGELKSLDKGVVLFKTGYGSSDFKIKWSSIKDVKTTSNYLITLSDGERLLGYISDGDSVGVTLVTEDGIRIVDNEHLVFLKSVKDDLKSQVYANVDVGFNLTKSKRLKQITGSAGIGFLGEFWSWDARVNTLTSSQDSVATTKRTDGIVSANVYLPNDLFVVGAIDFLSNTEQLLDLRSNARLGLGYYLVHKSHWYWDFSGGVAFVEEMYSSTESGKESMEVFVGSELNLFNIGDLAFFTKITAYPGITESGRFRTDLKMDMKYKLPFNFYIRGGLTVNHDNQPALGATETDYVLNTGLGWSL